MELPHTVLTNWLELGAGAVGLLEMLEVLLSFTMPANRVGGLDRPSELITTQPGCAHTFPTNWLKLRARAVGLLEMLEVLLSFTMPTNRVGGLD